MNNAIAQYTEEALMSSLAYGALTRKRLQAAAGTSDSSSPPGLKTYVDALAGLVPAEVLTIHAVVISQATETQNGTATITAAGPLAFFFWFLSGLSIVLYLVGRKKLIPSGWDWIRALIPPTAFVGWTMLQPTTAFDGVFPGFEPDWRWAVGLAVAIIVALVAGVLGQVADSETPA